MSQSDTLSLLLTAVFAAMIRLIDAWVIVQAGIPLDSLEPTPVDTLDAEAKRYVDMILADRKLVGTEDDDA